MDIKQIDRISDLASHCIEQDISERQGLMLRWELISPEIRAAMRLRWRGFIQGAIAAELQTPATGAPDSLSEAR
jgi:hypothetical protein